MIGNVSTAASTGTSAAAAKGSELDQLKKVAHQFEAVFLRQILSTARQSKLGEDIMGGDAGDQFRDMQDSRLADNMAEKGVFGVADLLVKQFQARVSSVAPGAAAADTVKGETK